MAKFRVLRRVDAYLDYVTEIDAPTAAEAAEIAYRDEEKYRWEAHGHAEFDARLFVALDTEGNEIDGTQQGDF
ncbi:MAG: hypothetical protein AB7O04_14200 [Hyphomonadaceae bacterium]